jgi:hypothetical protein
MPICHVARPAGHAAGAIEFSTGAPLDIRGRHGATKYERNTLIEVKPYRRLRV